MPDCRLSTGDTVAGVLASGYGPPPSDISDSLVNITSPTPVDHGFGND